MKKQKQEENTGRDDARKDIKAEDIPDLNKLRKELEEAKQELNGVRSEQTNLENLLKRAVADYQNLEKRVAEGRQEINSWAVTNLMRQIAQVMHYFDQAFKGVSEEEQKSNWFKGVKMANLQLAQVLQSEGLEEIKADPSTGLGTGSQFDPALHEAVDTREGEDGKILEVVEKGYKLNGKILKPAKVVVGKKQDNTPN